MDKNFVRYATTALPVIAFLKLTIAWENIRCLRGKARVSFVCRGSMIGLNARISSTATNIRSMRTHFAAESTLLSLTGTCALIPRGIILCEVPTTATSWFLKNSVFTCPRKHRKTAFSNIFTLESVLEKMCFR